MPALIYLHGFASGPGSRKAQAFAERFAALGVDIFVPELTRGDFRNLTISGQLQVVEELAGGAPVSLIGSSMGGYLAALYASLHPETEKLVLLAPAFGFLRHWVAGLGEDAVEQWRRDGVRKVFHYGEGREADLGYAIIEDGAQYPDSPAFTQPALIYHGTGDNVVPVEFSRAFAAQHPNATLREVASDHELLDVLDTVWDGARAFLME